MAKPGPKLLQGETVSESLSTSLPLSGTICVSRRIKSPGPVTIAGKGSLHVPCLCLSCSFWPESALPWPLLLTTCYGFLVLVGWSVGLVF